MNADARLDRDIRDALAWRAEHVARRQPSLAESSRSVARWVGSGPAIASPILGLRPGRNRPLQLALLALLVLLLAAGVVAVGSALLGPTRIPIVPGPLGLAGECNPTLPPEVVLEHRIESVPTTLHEDGLVVTDVSRMGPTRTSIVEGGGFEVRRLTDRGRDMVVERLAESGVTPGCRLIATSRASGSLRLRLPEGIADVGWGPAAIASPDLAASGGPAEREQRLLELADALRNLESWLPTDAWVESEIRRVEPERWMVTMGALPTDYQPGDRLDLPEGPMIEGSDPRYRAVALPGGVEPLEFGAELPVRGRFGPGSVERCGAVDRAAARALAESLDALQLGADGHGDLFSEDLGWTIGFELLPVDPAGRDCADLGAEALAEQQQPPPGPAPSGDLAGVDPCAMAGPTVLEHLEARSTEQARSRLQLGTAARACALHSFSHGFRSRVATLTLYPRTVDRADAEILAAEALGGIVATRALADGVAWPNECLASGHAMCPRRLAAWADGRLIVIEVDIEYFNSLILTVDEVAAAAAAALHSAGP